MVVQIDPITVNPRRNRLERPANEPCLEDTKLRTPNGFAFRPRTYYLPELKKALDEAYHEWKNDLPEPEYQALMLWYSSGFKAINRQLREPDACPGQLQESIKALSSAINLAPPIPSAVRELFRGESHQLLTLEDAQRRCAEGFTGSLSASFLATTIYENEAFNFARDYHASGFTEGGLMIPIGALQKPAEQQIIFRYILPDDRTGLKAAWIGQTIGEMLFPPYTRGQWLHAEQVAYIPADDMEDLISGKKSDIDLAADADCRLLVTIKLLPTLKPASLNVLRSARKDWSC